MTALVSPPVALINNFLVFRWQSWERWQAAMLQYAPEESQLLAEWGRLVAAADIPGTPLHQV